MMESLRLPQDILGLYQKQKLELHFRDKSDSEFMTFLLDTAVRVISIVQHLAPVIEAVSGDSTHPYDGTVHTKRTKTKKTNAKQPHGKTLAVQNVTAQYGTGNNHVQGGHMTAQTATQSVLAGQTTGQHHSTTQFTSYTRALHSTLPASHNYLASAAMPNHLATTEGVAGANQNFSPNKLSRIWKALSGDDSAVSSLLPPQLIPTTAGVQMDSSLSSICQNVTLCNTQLRSLSDVTMAAPAGSQNHEYEQTRVDNPGTKKLCQYCNKLITKTYLNLHVRTVHLRIRPYPCPYCQATFTQSASKNYHVQHVHKEM